MRLLGGPIGCGLLLIAGCGGGHGDPDAREVSDEELGIPHDAPTDVIIENFGSDEGGEVRLEWIQFPNGNKGARGTAFFYKNPGTTKFWPFLNLDGCTDLTGANGHDKWPKAQSADRTYYDVGPYVNVSGAAPATAPFVIAKNTTGTPARDPVGRVETANNWYFDNAVSTDTDGDNLLPSNTFFGVTLPGSSTYAGHTYENAVYMPGPMTTMTPPFSGTAVATTSGGDLTFVFNNATSHPPIGPDGTTLEVQNLVAFTAPMPVGETAGPAVICIKRQEAGPTTTVTVPGAMVDIARTAYPAGGVLARQTVVHQVKGLVDETGAATDRRVDFIGVWCYAGQPWSAN